MSEGIEFKKDAEFTLRLVNKFLGDMTPEQRRALQAEIARWRAVAGDPLQPPLVTEVRRPRAS